MSFGYPVLLGSDKLAPSYRWRLLDGMFSAWRPLVEGGCAYAAASLVCLFETKNWAFLELLVGSVVLLCGRLLEARHYARVAQERRRSPEYWAMRYSVGAVAAAAMWVGMDVAAVDATEPDLPFFVLVLQSAWIGSSSPRTAAFPAAAFLQALSILAPGIIFALFAHDRFLAVFAPLNVIQLAGNVGIMRAVGAQIVAGLLSEQRLEAANAQLLELSSTDGLTGIANRRAFEALFQTEWARAARGGTDLAVLMIDVDNFKAYKRSLRTPRGGRVPAPGCRTGGGPRCAARPIKRRVLAARSLLPCCRAAMARQPWRWPSGCAWRLWRQGWRMPATRSGA